MWSKLSKWSNFITRIVVTTDGDKRVAMVTVTLAVFFCVLSLFWDE